MIGADPAPAPAGKETNLSFVKDVQPILQTHCVSCHGNGKAKGGLNLDTRENLVKGSENGPVLTIGNSGESSLIALVSGENPEVIMPPKGKKLTKKEVATLATWIDGGLEWPEGFSFARGRQAPLEPRKVEVPAATDASGPNPIDRLLQSYYAEKKVDAAKPLVDDRTFARRVWLDLIGLLPPPAELDAFIADKAADKREKLVAKLLGDTHAYAAHWLSFWNDALRNDYAGTGYIDGGRKQVTVWLYESLVANKPYDQFVRELVAAAPGAEGFTNGIVWRGAVNASQVPPMQAAQNVSQVFMGVNLKCASCHDSFINQWKLDDAYGLAAIYADGPLEKARCEVPLGEMAQVKFLYPQLGSIDAAAPRPQRLERLAQVITDERNGRLTRTMVNRVWARLMGRGLIEPTDEMDHEPWNADLLDWLASDLVANKYDLKKTMTTVVLSRAYQMPAAGAREDETENFVFRGPLMKRMSAEQFVDAVASLTGVPPGKAAVERRKGPKAERGKLDPPAEIFPDEALDRVRASMCRANPLMAALGRPNREQTVTARPTAATTLQALELTNGIVLTKMLAEGARKGAATQPANPQALVRDLYAKAFGRAPGDAELSVAEETLAKHAGAQGIEDLLWAMIMQPEFQLIR